MQYHNHRETTLLENPIPLSPILDKDIHCDFLIVWGGVAGLHSALELIKQWVDASSIVLVEKTICGGGMSGRSGWFLTPDSELGLRALEKRFGDMVAKKIWDFGSKGEESIVNNVHNLKLHCDLRNQDSMLLWVGMMGKDACKEEDEGRKKFGFDSDFIKSSKDLKKYISWKNYTAGVRYENSFGISAFQYCQWLRAHLISLWVNIYEQTHIDTINDKTALTDTNTISFKQSFLCPGKVTKELSASKSKLLYGVVNFICVSEPLSEEQIQEMMPNGELMCRDTKLVFNYYRLIEWNRIILGWGNPISSFLPWDVHYESSILSTIKDFKKTFPCLKELEFMEYWSGRIQVSKDLMPIIDLCHIYDNQIRVLWCAGLPRAAACGEFAVKRYFGNHDSDLEKVFCEKRKRFIPRFPTQKILKSIFFALSNAWSMFFQKGY